MDLINTRIVPYFTSGIFKATKNNLFKMIESLM